MDESIPKCVLPHRWRNRPWLSKKLIQAIWRSNILYELAKSTGDLSRFKHYRNKVVNQLKVAKRAFFQRINHRYTPRNSGKLVSSCTKHLAPISLSYQVMVKLHRPVRKKPSYWMPSLPLVLTHPIPLLILLIPWQLTNLPCTLSRGHAMQWGVCLSATSLLRFLQVQWTRRGLCLHAQEYSSQHHSLHYHAVQPVSQNRKSSQALEARTCNTHSKSVGAQSS